MADSANGFMSYVQRSKRKLVMACLLALTPMMVGCYGDFPLTHAVYRMNGRVENTLVEQVVFWAFVILPVYGGAFCIDALVFNLVDFWFDEDVDISQYETPEGETVTVEPSQSGDELTVTVTRDGEVQNRMTFVRMEDHIEARDIDGNVVGQVEVDEDGTLKLMDENGSVVRTISAAQTANASS
jgi:hypothetical protein